VKVIHPFAVLADMNTIICNGGYRSGSTLVFNICREILEYQGNDFSSYGKSAKAIDKRLISAPKQQSVIKCHLYTHEPQEGLGFVYSHRDYRGVAASMRMLMMREWEGRAEHGLTDEDWAYVMDILYKADEVYKHTKGRSDVFIFDYDTALNGGIMDWVKSISEFMGCHVPWGECQSIAQRVGVKRAMEITEWLTALRMPADSRTELRRNHIGEFEGKPRAWEEVLPTWISEYIAAEFKLGD